MSTARINVCVVVLLVSEISFLLGFPNLLALLIISLLSFSTDDHCVL